MNTNDLLDYVTSAIDDWDGRPEFAHLHLHRDDMRSMVDGGTLDSTTKQKLLLMLDRVIDVPAVHFTIFDCPVVLDDREAVQGAPYVDDCQSVCA